MAKLTRKTQTVLASRAALAASLLSLGVISTAQTAQPEQSWDAAPTTFDHFTDADGSGDGLLDANEYESFLSAVASSGDLDAQTALESGELDVSFVNADVDGDGLLSYGEVHMAMEPEAGAEMAEPAEEPAPELHQEPKDYPASHSETDDMGHETGKMSAEPEPQ